MRHADRGADKYGRKELPAMTDGFREGSQSWRDLLHDHTRRSLKQDPKPAIQDDALRLWTALQDGLRHAQAAA